jgi:hypothetical protein
MSIGISEVNAAATIPVVDFHVVRCERPAAIRLLFRLYATENIVEFGFADYAARESGIDTKAKMPEGRRSSACLQWFE